MAFSVAGIAVTGACSHTSDTETTQPVASATGEPAAAASATASASTAPVAAGSASSVTPATKPPATKAPASGWTDPENVQKLAQNCAWLPPVPKQDDVDWASDPLRCERNPGQNCNPDACTHTDDQCYPACAKTCDGCGAKCVTGCETCKKDCKDDACREKCATSCASCHQHCLTDLDHCTSGHCGELEATCIKAEIAEYKATKCNEVCAKVSDCFDKCRSSKNMSDWTVGGPCAEACAKKLMGPSCPAKWLLVCTGGMQAPDTLMPPQ